MRKLYDAHTDPVVLVGAASTLLFFFYQALESRQLDRWTEVAMVVLAMSVAIRLIQSAALAKLDYATLPTTPFGVSMIALLTIFTAVPTVHFMSKSGDYVAWSVASYALGALFGAINFLVLYSRDIPRMSHDCDVPIELRIQALNSAVFVAMTVLLGGATWTMLVQPPREAYFYATISLCVVLLWVNVWHSGALTKYPKFLMHNRLPTSASTVLRALNVGTAVAAAVAADPPLYTMRARRQDVEHIASSLIDEFGYMFSFIFGTGSKLHLSRWLTVLLTTAGGLSEFGYFRFYMIFKRGSPEPIGFFKIDTTASLFFYDWLGRILCPISLWRAGLRDVRGTVRRARFAISLQGTPQSEDLALSYLVIFRDHRRQCYGSAFLRMLELAHLWFDTNGVESRRVVLCVRRENTAARHVFQRAGYVDVEPARLESGEDPWAQVAGIGPLLRLERVIEESGAPEAT